MESESTFAASTHGVGGQKIGCGDDDVSLSQTGICGDFYVFGECLQLGIHCVYGQFAAGLVGSMIGVTQIARSSDPINPSPQLGTGERQ